MTCCGLGDNVFGIIQKAQVVSVATLLGDVNLEE